MQSFGCLRLSVCVSTLCLLLSLAAASAETLDFTRTSIDDSFTAYISTNNGLVGAFYYSHGCCGTFNPNVTVTLTPGVDYFIQIVAINDGGAGGWGGQFMLSGGNDRFINGTTTEDTAITPSDWKASDGKPIGTSWANSPLSYTALKESDSGNPYAGLGLLWSPGPNGGPNPGFWNGQCTNCQVDFSTEILAPVPEPSTVLDLFGGTGGFCLAGILVRRFGAKLALRGV
jgi:hypothetical protein